MSGRQLSRRRFIEVLPGLGLGAAGLAGGALGQPPAAPQGEPVSRLAEDLFVFRGPINVGIVRHGERALLIDCGDGRVLEALDTLGIRSVDRILFTHHHRDQCCGAGRFGHGTAIVVPEAERPHFDDVASYWNDPRNRWHIYNFRPHHMMLAEPLRVDATVGDGDEFTWGPATIRVLATPGHTDGSLSYLVEVEGRRAVFCGDLIYDGGQIWELYSLQKGLRWEGGGTSDYHGFLGARHELTASLDRIRRLEPDCLVPAHGRTMDEPDRAIYSLRARLAEGHDRYAAISALRHYFPAAFAEYEGRSDHMAIRPGKAPPDCLRHFGTTWVLISKTGAALVMDCGHPRVVENVRALRDRGEITAVEGLWITHYHDDHVDGVPAFQDAFDCPCITDRHVAEVIGNPLAWRLPCISPHQARVDRATEDGESWKWHEFQLTAFHLPGQTLYHAGLLVEGERLRMLFAGDSFTMGGIDDYCAQNRNWLGAEVGFDRCIDLIEELQPTHIFNCHVDDAFDFTLEQCLFMRDNLARREALFGRLFPWDHANYGMDESWVRPFPYEQQVAAGGRAALELVVTNHSPEPVEASCRPVLPKSWRLAATGWTTAAIPAGQEGALPITFPLPADVEAGRRAIPIDLRYGPWDLPQFAAAMVVVSDVSARRAPSRHVAFD